MPENFKPYNLEKAQKEANRLKDIIGPKGTGEDYTAAYNLVKKENFGKAKQEAKSKLESFLSRVGGDSYDSRYAEESLRNARSIQQKFNIPAGSTTTVVLQINVPAEVAQKDYYYSLIFQSENEKSLGESSSQTRGRIGSNLLISVTNDENPFKIAEIQKFSAPLIIDSLTKINYSFILKNVGRTLFKPIGRITVNNLFSRRKTNLELAPQNVLAYSERKIFCLKEESLTDCNLDSPVLLGLYKAKLDFTLDGESKIYQAEVVTLALPFSLIIVLAVICIILTTVINKIKVKNIVADK